MSYADGKAYADIGYIRGKVELCFNGVMRAEKNAHYSAGLARARVENK